MVELFNDGGWAMYPLLILLILGIGVAIERLHNLSRAAIDAEGFFKNLEEAVDFVFEEQKKDSDNKSNIEEVLKELPRYIEQAIQYEARKNRDAIRHLDEKMEDIFREFGLRG